MASSSPLASPTSWLNGNFNPNSTIQPYGYALTAFVVIVFSVVFKLAKQDDFPLVNSSAWYRPLFLTQLDFLKTGMKLVSDARVAFAGKPYRVVTEGGEVIVLPGRFAHIIRNENDLDFGACIMKDFHAHLPGFEPFAFISHNTQILQVVARKQLTKHLNTVTEPLSLETAFATNLILGDSPGWREIPAKDSILDLVARLSSRVFLGTELCRNEDWLRVTKEYTVMSFGAAIKLQAVPALLRPLMHRLSPDGRRVRDTLSEARALIAPIIASRRAAKQRARDEGKDEPSFNDAIEWAEVESQGSDYDAAVFQLTLSFAAIHTTTDLLAQTLIFLANEPELVAPLREEIVRVLRAEGWRKSALFNMKMLDSTLKEAQRLKPNSMLPMRRLAMKDVHLPGSITIRRGQRLVVDGYAVKDPARHADVDKFDIYRFKRMREQPENAHKAQLVATSPDHLSFGHGQHACPGRFFASNEVKVALCHLLLKYDWKLAPGCTADPVVVGAALSVNPKTRVLVRKRRRDEIEIDMDELGFAHVEA